MVELYFSHNQAKVMHVSVWLSFQLSSTDFCFEKAELRNVGTRKKQLNVESYIN